MKRIIAIFVLLIYTFSVYSQTIRFTKVMVGDNGSILLEWNYTGDENMFSNYVIEKYINDSYQYIATISEYQTNSWTDVSARENEGVKKYRILANSVDGNTLADTVFSINLEVSDISATSVTAFLAWNEPMLDIGGYNYLIQRKIQNKTLWHTIASTTNTMYTDTIQRSVCNDTITYRVLLIDGVDTFATSCISGGTFFDPMPTSPCTLDVVTVTEDLQQIKLSWLPSPDNDIWGYFICRGNPCMALDTIYGKYNTSYIDEVQSVLDINDYRIYAFDSCFTASALTKYYHNIVLKGSVVDCSNTIEISWNEYINMPNGLLNYTVRIRYNNTGDFEDVVVKDASATELQHIFDVPEGTETVEIKVVAMDNMKQTYSESNILVLNLLIPNSAQFLYIRTASVADDNSKINLLFYVDTSYTTSEYILYKKENTKPYHIHDYIYPTGDDLITYIDYDVDVLNKKYTYFLAVKDECGITETKSNEVSPVFLKLEQNNNINCLSYTEYLGWDSVKYYRVYKRKETDTQWKNIGRINYGDVYFCDTEDNIFELTEKVYYKIVAYQGDSSEYLFRDTSQSAYTFFARKGEVWIANAFTPQKDNNNVLKPYISFVGKENYLFQIYTRAGLLVFETTDINQGWDGTFNDEYVQQGTYVYVIYCKFTDGTNYVHKGTVTVL